MKKNIPNNIRKYREARGFTQRDISKQLGFASDDRISYWEHGTAVPSIFNLFNLAKILEVLPHELYPDLFNKS